MAEFGYTILALLVLTVSVCHGYRILALFPFEIKSHHVILEPIVEALALKGHQVDVVSHFKLSRSMTNYKNIIQIPASREPPTVRYDDLYSKDKDTEWEIIVNARMCELLGHPVLSEIIKNPPKDPPYDFILIELARCPLENINDNVEKFLAKTGNISASAFHYFIVKIEVSVSAEKMLKTLIVAFKPLQLTHRCQCLNAIGHLWDIPVGIVATTTLYPQMHHYIDNPMNLATLSNTNDFYKEEMNFWERLYNFVITHINIYTYYRDHSALQDYYIRKYLGNDMPSFLEIEKSPSLILINSHFSFNGVRLKSPALIEIGGINIKNDSSKMSPDLKKILDESKDGFIYFSFGSLFVIESLPHEVLERFYRAIRKIAPVRVIMKAPHPEAMPKNMPDNVITFSWLPQQKLLQHPNIKGFVTHGGALGTQEAIFSKVPMICVPLFADQFVNCDISVVKSIALKIDIRTAKDEDYQNAFNQLLTNPLYKKSIDKLNAVIWDRPQTPREAAVYWIEFVIRHGKHVLRSPARNLKWWQIELFDIYAFLLACALTFTFLTIFITRRLFRLILKLVAIKESHLKNLRRFIKKAN